MNGKGRGPERGRNLQRFRAGYDAINWRRPTAPGVRRHPDQKKEAARTACRKIFSPNEES